MLQAWSKALQKLLSVPLFSVFATSARQRSQGYFGFAAGDFLQRNEFTVAEAPLAAASPYTPCLGGNRLAASLGDLLGLWQRVLILVDHKVNF
jgi:hypothetical protein